MMEVGIDRIYSTNPSGTSTLTAPTVSVPTSNTIPLQRTAPLTQESPTSIHQFDLPRWVKWIDENIIPIFVGIGLFLLGVTVTYYTQMSSLNEKIAILQTKVDTAKGDLDEAKNDIRNIPMMKMDIAVLQEKSKKK